MTTTAPSLPQLQRALEIAQQIETLEGELRTVLASASSVVGEAKVASKSSTGRRRSFSSETKAKMAAAQKARWAAKRDRSENRSAVSKLGVKKKRVLSAEGRARIVAALKRRHASKKAKA